MNFIFFVLIRQNLSDQIQQFSANVLQNAMMWIAYFALTLVTIWVFMIGYRVITGQLRESMMGVVINMARVAFIVTIATTGAFFGTDINTFFNTTLNQAINKVVTGDSSTIDQSIDKNLAYTEVAMSAIDAVQLIPGDTADTSAANRASFLAGIGTAGPPILAAVMELMYQFAMALVVGLGPLFILCLIFEQTKPLFQRWLLYGIGTLFSMALLNVVTAMVLNLTLKVAAGMWVEGMLQKVFLGNVEGISHQAMEQGGLGMILSLLIVTVPPMASNFFQGTLGNLQTYSAFGFARAGQGGGGLPWQQGNPNGQRNDNAGSGSAGATNASGQMAGNSTSRITGNPSQPSGDQIKHPSSPPNGPSNLYRRTT